MPDFDPDKYIQETGMGNQSSFDPDKYLADTGLAAKMPASAEDDHAFGPFVKKNAQALWDLSGKVGHGMVEGALHPIDTANHLKDAIMDTSPRDVAAGASRAVRNIPLAGQVVDKMSQGAHALPALLRGDGLAPAAAAMKEFKGRQDAADHAHALEHPLTDFIQKAAGVAAMPGGAVGQLSAMSADAFTKSMENGNNAYDALRDAQNVAALGSIGLLAGHAVSQVPGMMGRSFAKQAGVSEEAMQDYVQQAKGPIAEPVPAPSPEQVAQKSFFDSFKKKAPVPENAPIAAPPAPFLEVGEPNFTFGKKAGQLAGGAAGGFAGGPVPAVVGRDIGGHLGHAAIDGLANKYGHEAVKMALDGGIKLDKLADSPYIGTLMEAAAKSPKSLAVTHYILGQTNPGYQELTK